MNARTEEKVLIGLVERVSVTGDTPMDAKSDTGADYSSVHADDIRHFVRGNRRWIGFARRGQDGRRIIRQPDDAETDLPAKTRRLRRRGCGYFTVIVITSE